MRRLPGRYLKAIGFHEQAIARDPAFALTHARLAYVGIAYSTGFAIVAQEEREAFIVRASTAVTEAVKLDPDLAEAHPARAFILNVIDFELGGAATNFFVAWRIEGLAPAGSSSFFSARRFAADVAEHRGSRPILLSPRDP